MNKLRDEGKRTRDTERCNTKAVATLEKTIR
jgi:hypothetical protein